MASVEQDLGNMQARLDNLDLQAYASGTTTFGELQANHAHQAAIKAHAANLKKSRKFQQIWSIPVLFLVFWRLVIKVELHP